MPTRERSRLRSLTPGIEDVLAVEQYFALGALVRIKVVHAVQTRSSVDFPQPDGPMKAVTLFARRPAGVMLFRARACRP